MARMSSPVKGYVTQHYKHRRHLGMDLATGGKPRNVHATFAGKVERVVSGREPGNTTTDNYARGRTGNYVVVRNPDGERQIYNHTTAKVRKGDSVVVGQVIGVTDRSGRSTGDHLHYEEWDKWGRTRDPMVSFRAFGVTPGQTPVRAKAPALKYPDRDLKNGESRTEAWQILLNSVGYDSNSVSVNQQSWLSDLGYYDGRIDGDFGELSIRALQSFLYDKGLYRNGRYRKSVMVDGVNGKRTQNASTAYLNDQRRYL